MFNSLVNNLKSLLYSLLLASGCFMLLAKIFRVTAITGKGSNLCLKEGFLPLPIDYHSPVPAIRDLERRGMWNVRSELRGIDFRENVQIELLNELGLNYSDECRWSLLPTENPTEFYLNNESFSYGCAASTHCIIRHFRPKRVVEIGSGMSSMVISNALLMNRSEENELYDYVIVDPYPTNIIRSGAVSMTDLIEKRVELLNPAFFDQLKANDILFIDSGHCVRIGGDVNYLFLDVFPRLKPGILVHVHDISTPFEYPKVYATSETFRQFWTEQYLLQGFLCFNSEFEVLLAMNYLMKDHLELFRKAFPFYDPNIHHFTSSSFWMRRKEGLKG